MQARVARAASPGSSRCVVCGQAGIEASIWNGLCLPQRVAEMETLPEALPPSCRQPRPEGQTDLHHLVAPEPQFNENDDDDEDVLAAVVIHSGSTSIQAGFSSDDVPRSIFQNVVGSLREDMVGSIRLLMMQRRDSTLRERRFVGDTVADKRWMLDLIFPIEFGVVKDWDAMQEVWKHTFYNELRVDPNEQHVLMTEPPLNSKAHRERMVEVCLGVFRAPGLYVASAALLSLRHSLGTADDVCYTGVVLASGASTTHVVPISDGYVVHHAVRSVHIGGRELDRYMAELLNDRGYVEDVGNVEMTFVRGIKESLAYVASESIEAELLDRADGVVQRRFHRADFELGNGIVWHVGDASCRCPEALFKPALLGREDIGLPEHVYRAVMACSSPEDWSLRCLRCVVLSGGNTLLSGIRERVERELRQLAAPHGAAERRLAFAKLMTNPCGMTGDISRSLCVDAAVYHTIGGLVEQALHDAICVVAPQHRHYSAWIGGAALCRELVATSADGLNTKERWLTREEYERGGATTIHAHCLG